LGNRRTAVVLTISDSGYAGQRVDLSGPAVAEVLRQCGFHVQRQVIVADDQPKIEAALKNFCEQVQLIITTGGTGVAERDVTPEATRAICSRFLDGIPERMRAAGFKRTPMALLSRSVCGIRGRTIILNLPGSPDGAVQSLQAVVEVLPHAVDLLAGKTAHNG
jgi:molybdopterin adenylyltransferase